MQFLHHTYSPLSSAACTSHPSRLIQDAPSLAELSGFIEAQQNDKLKDKVQENYDKKIATLADRVKTLETAGKSPTEIKQELQKEKAKIIQEAINQALQELKITRKVNGKDEQITYQQLTTHPTPAIKQTIEAIYSNFDAKISPAIDQAVDQYFTQKAAATAKATAGLQALPDLQPSDPTAANPETARLQAIIDRRSGINTKAKNDLAALKPDQAEAYRARTSLADMMTAPSGGAIDNYETDYKFWSKDVTNEKNPTRFRLQGFLYANDIFAGGGLAGQAAMTEAIKEPRKLYLNHMPDKLSAEDLETSMAMSSYFVKAKEFSPNFERVIGTIAGLHRLSDKNIPNKEVRQRYQDYLFLKCADLKTMDTEEKQLEYLYGLQSFPEFIGADPNWRANFSHIDEMTDPDAPGAKITDYPGTFSENKNNKTRWDLNGYLFSVYLFNGKNQAAVDREYARAVKMYKASGLINEDFTQDMIENDPKGKEDGFGLKKSLIEADKFTAHEQVRAAIAGLFKQADDAGNPKYRAYLEAKLDGLSKADSEEAQMIILSTIKSSAEADKEVTSDLFSKIIQSAIEASKQHNQVALEKKFKDRFEKDPQTFPLPEIEKLARDVKTELDNFVTTRSDSALQTMQTKHDRLVKTNADLAKIKDKSPLYVADNLNPLATSIEANALDFTKAKSITKEAALDGAINNKYLQTLSNAEKTYFNIVEQLDAMQKAVDEQAQSKAPAQDKLPEAVDSDPYKANWEKGQRVEPVLKDYQGPLIADSVSTVDKVTARDKDGNPKGEIANGTELIRTEKDSKILARHVEHLNFIRVHQKNNLQNDGIWIPEEQLYKPEDHGKATETPAAEKPAPEKPAPEKPKFATSGLEAIFTRVAREVEVNPFGSTFETTYNGKGVGCRVQKLPDGYHFIFNNLEAGQGDVVFRTFPEIRNYLENGGFYQRLAMQTLLDRKNWDRYKSEKWLDEVVDLKRTGDWTLSIELDWKRNNVFETGNGKIDLSVGQDGRINYTIHKDHVGSAGENIRTGFASDLNQLTQALNHAKTWSENYEDNQTEARFPAMLEREKALSALMDAQTFDKLAPQIGEKYYFNNFYTGNYSYMRLNWDKQPDLFARNRSLTNPILETRLNPDNTISWKLLNQSGDRNAWVGTAGQARDITDLAYQVEKVKQDPAKSLTKPATQLPNLGGLGYYLYQ